MLRLLKYIKRHLPFVWRIIDSINELAIRAFYGKKIGCTTSQVLSRYQGGRISYRVLQQDDMGVLCDMITRQPDGFDQYFKPHAFDAKSLRTLCEKHSILMLGVFDGEEIAGYFFIRFFANGKAFRGKMVDVKHQGKGIAKQMGAIMTDIALNAGFRLFATISKANLASIASSEAVNEIMVIKELPDDYIYVQYKRK